MTSEAPRGGDQQQGDRAAGATEPTFSLIVSTLGRSEEIGRLFASLGAQTMTSFEVVVVDQNDDALPAGLWASCEGVVPVTHLHSPGERGLSRGRNRGLAVARGAFCLFPDDDCWYAEDFLARATHILTERGADALAGRAAGEDGRSINGRFEETAQPITRANVWTTQIEWMVFYRRTLLTRIGGFDEAIGVGADTPWQSCEGQDAMLRFLGAGGTAWYDPSLTGRHAELDVSDPDQALVEKGRRYARGAGYVLRKHRFGPLAAFYWTVRPIGRLALSAARGRRSQVPYYRNVALGRLEGYARRPRS